VPYQLDTELDLMPETSKKYYVSSAHRRIQKDKSRWTVAVDLEVECFVGSQLNGWIEDVTSWGIMQKGNNLMVLGENSQKELLKIAKFISKNGNNVWHGYPADFRRNGQDRPGMTILQNWRTSKVIEKHHILKIRQGKECNL
jgi:hypothetical protein